MGGTRVSITLVDALRGLGGQPWERRGQPVTANELRAMLRRAFAPYEPAITINGHGRTYRLLEPSDAMKLMRAANEFRGGDFQGDYVCWCISKKAWGDTLWKWARLSDGLDFVGIGTAEIHVTGAPYRHNLLWSICPVGTLTLFEPQTNRQAAIVYDGVFEVEC